MFGCELMGVDLAEIAHVDAVFVEGFGDAVAIAEQPLVHTSQ